MTGPAVRVVGDAATVDGATRDGLLACWVDVTNAGGAVGFPFPPVTCEQVAPALDALLGGLSPGGSRLLVAADADGVAGWVHLARGAGPLTQHWGTVERLQSRPERQGQGIGGALLARLELLARDELGLEHLWLVLRGGLGLEAFYERRGWHVAGVHRGALRLAPGDTRDEVLMQRLLAGAPAAGPAGPPPAP